MFATFLHQGASRIAGETLPKAKAARFPGPPRHQQTRVSPGICQMSHATCPCLAKTRCFLPLISLAAAIVQAQIRKWSYILAGISGLVQAFFCLERGGSRRPALIRPASGGRKQGLDRYYFRIFATTPAPTVRPPSRMAKRRASSIATGLISETTICTLSPGITISVPSGSSTAPVISVVRK